MDILRSDGEAVGVGVLNRPELEQWLESSVFRDVPCLVAGFTTQAGLDCAASDGRSVSGHGGDSGESACKKCDARWQRRARHQDILQVRLRRAFAAREARLGGSKHDAVARFISLFHLPTASDCMSGFWRNSSPHFSSMRWLGLLPCRAWRTGRTSRLNTFPKISHKRCSPKPCMTISTMLVTFRC